MTVRLRIVSDGTPAGTHLFAGDEEIDGHQITEISWSISARPPGGQVAFATIDVQELPVDLAGETTP